MEDPIFDPWCLGEESEPPPERRASRWRSATASQRLPPTPAPRPVSPVEEREPKEVEVPGTDPVGGRRASTQTVWFIDEPLDDVSRAEIIAAAGSPLDPDVDAPSADAVVPIEELVFESPETSPSRAPKAPAEAPKSSALEPPKPYPVGPPRPSSAATPTSTSAKAAKPPSPRPPKPLPERPGRPPEPRPTAVAPEPHDAEEAHRVAEILRPRLLDVGRRLRLHGHDVTIDDGLHRDPPSIRVTFEPRRGPFDGVVGPAGSVLELALAAPSEVVARFWIHPASSGATEGDSIASGRLDADWVDRVVLAFVEKALREE